MLRYQDFLALVIDESKLVASNCFRFSDPYAESGALAGLEACRDKSPPQLSELLERSYRVHHTALHETVMQRYVKITAFLHEVLWVCTVISCVLVNQGIDPIVPPTLKAARVAERISKSGLALN